MNTLSDQFVYQEVPSIDSADSVYFSAALASKGGEAGTADFKLFYHEY